MTAPASTPPLLQITDLHTWFPIKRGIFSHTVGYVRALDGVSVHVDPGETLALVGESGCGKTTLARTVMRLDPARSGSVVFDGVDILALSPHDLRPIRRELQMVFQDPFSSLNPRLTVLEIVTEGLLAHGMIQARQKESEAVRLLAEVGMGPDALHRYPHEFSGGQRQRISVARALSMRPRMIICDEAVSALDVSVQAQVLNLLIALREKYHLSYVFISHDLSVVRQISERVAVMYLGLIAEQGRTGDVIDRPCHPYTRALVSAVPRAGEVKKERMILTGDVPSPARPPSGCRFHPRCPYAIPECSRAEPQLEPVNGRDPSQLAACIRRNDI